MRTLFIALSMTFLMAGCSSCTETSSSDTPTGDMATIHITRAEFIEKIADIDSNSEWKYLGDRPAVVDFYADWCGPCKAIAPSLEELARQYEGKIYIYKVDVDKEPALAADFGIRSIPTLLFIPMKGEPQKVTGAMPKGKIEDTIKNVLLGE